MKRLSLLGMATVLAATVLVSTSGAAGSHAVRFDGIVKLSDVVLTDVKGDGPGPGDIFTFTATGYDKTGKNQVSKGHGYCMFGAPRFSTCTVVASYGNGKIVLTWENNGNSSGANQVAITGGTRSYRTIRGDGSVKQTSASDPTTFRLKLNGSTR